MRLTIRLLGTEVLHISTDPDSPSPESEADAHLSGGTLSSSMIDAGPTDRYMGFTNGAGDGE